jgi:fused signal recognition particle receptor
VSPWPARLVEKLGKERFGKEVTDEEVRAAFADDIAEILQPVAVPLAIDTARKPHVVLVVGVNGSGKTTTIAKLASLYRGEGRSVMLAAGDTFRAAAVEQLKVWGDRAGVPVVSKPTGADAAGLAYEALERARAEKTDVLLIDTAGRLHNKANLMEELAKIVRVTRASSIRRRRIPACWCSMPRPARMPMLRSRPSRPCRRSMRWY